MISFDSPEIQKRWNGISLSNYSAACEEPYHASVTAMMGTGHNKSKAVALTNKHRSSWTIVRKAFLDVAIPQFWPTLINLIA